MNIKERYQIVKEEYAKLGVDTDKALERLSNIAISLHCWQGDDVRGFISGDELSGGIQTTGNYPGRARNVQELRKDIEKVLSLLPGKYKLNLHAIYVDTDEKVELDQIEPRHYEGWVKWAKENNVGLDFNPTCFSHPKAESGFTLSSNDDEIRNFWIEHCKRSRKIGEYFGRELGIPCVTNIWVPDGYKDIPYDRLAPRMRLKDSLDQILEEKIDSRYNIDAMESKVFGIGVESYTVGNNEFYVGYAVQNQTALTLDSGHYHPTEYISDKISSALLFVPHILLHVSRPVRWDSDHVVIFDDELKAIAQEIVRSGEMDRIHIGLDFFDASINRIAAWVIGARNLEKALLYAMLEPTELLKKYELEMDYTSRLGLLETLKSYPFTAVWQKYCLECGVPTGFDWMNEVKEYEKEVLSKR